MPKKIPVHAHQRAAILAMRGHAMTAKDAVFVAQDVAQRLADDSPTLAPATAEFRRKLARIRAELESLDTAVDVFIISHTDGGPS